MSTYEITKTFTFDNAQINSEIHRRFIETPARIIRCMELNQSELLEYCCPHCFENLYALRPIEDDGFWSAVVQCSICSNRHIREVFRDGLVMVSGPFFFRSDVPKGVTP